MQTADHRLLRIFRRVVMIEHDEIVSTIWSFIFFFCLMSGYYILRAIRDEMGITSGIANLPWLFTATFIAMLVLVPVYGWLISRMPRQRFMNIIYSFFTINLLVFYGLYKTTIEVSILAKIFYVWVSVYNLFIVSVFWSFMSDIYNSERASRLFGFIASGATVGGLVGPLFPALLATTVGALNLLLVTAVLLMAALFCVHRLSQWQLKNIYENNDEKMDKDSTQPVSAITHQQQGRVGGTVLAAFKLIYQSPYLLAVCLIVFLFTLLGTFVYFQRAYIVEASFTSSDQRTAVFAWMDFATNAMTIIFQWFVTARLIRRFGVAVALMVLPFVFALGFLLFGFSQTLSIIVVFEVLRRSLNFAVNRPCREILFTVVTKEERYKAKNFIDTVIYRGGDAVSSWVYAGLQALGLSIAAISFVAVPLCAVWVVFGYFLGQKYRSLLRNR
jgi:AAA family ATP:ADP antiporter